MFKKTAENVHGALVFQKNLDIRMEYNDTSVVYAEQYFNQNEDRVVR